VDAQAAEEGARLVFAVDSFQTRCRLEEVSAAFVEMTTPRLPGLEIASRAVRAAIDAASSLSSGSGALAIFIMPPT
jgi:hypothetical protein